MTIDRATRLLDEKGRWHARDVRYLEGAWDDLCREMPVFEKQEYRAEADAPANPYMQSVIRVPRTKMERPIPVGVVSNTYRLAQHRDVAEECRGSILESGVEEKSLRYQIGLTELGEWMNLRIYLPESLDHVPSDGHRVRPRIECFNSVDGSSRLVLLMGWQRLVCSNGLVMNFKSELKAVHNQHLKLGRIGSVVRHGMAFIQEDRDQLLDWELGGFTPNQLASWVDGPLAVSWGRKAASRVYHVCLSGFDVEYADRFEKEAPSVKKVKRTTRVPGAPNSAGNLYDVAQALSWIASSRLDSEERIAWQSQVPGLVEQLRHVFSEAGDGNRAEGA